MAIPVSLTAAEADVLAAAPFAITRSGKVLVRRARDLQLAAIQNVISKGLLEQAALPGADGRSFTLTAAGARFVAT